MDLKQYIDQLKGDRDFESAFVYHRYIPSIKPEYGPSLEFHKDIRKIMKRLDLDRLYSHQAKAIEHLREGRNVLVATPTATC